MPLIGRDPGLASFLTNLGEKIVKSGSIKSVLCVSAHWEEKVPTILTCEKPELYFDYYGFPPETYKYSYPTTTDNSLNEKIGKLLGDAGFQIAEDEKRGYDHGVFVPLLLMLPKANIPVSQVSLMSSLSAKDHWKLGEALMPLRKEGCLIIGSGMSYHGFFQRPPVGVTAQGASKAFDEYLHEVLPGKDRKKGLLDWEKAKHARVSHPREEHLIPLMVVAAAAKDEKVSCIYRVKGQIWISSFQFGEL